MINTSFRCITPLSVFGIDKRGRRVVSFILYAWSCFEPSCYGIITCNDNHRLRVFWAHWSKIFSRFARQATRSTKEAIWFTSNACYYELLPVTCSSVIEKYYPKQAIVIMTRKGDNFIFLKCDLQARSSSPV